MQVIGDKEAAAMCVQTLSRPLGRRSQEPGKGLVARIQNCSLRSREKIKSQAKGLLHKVGKCIGTFVE
jgi:hypothetical protein